jgi:hypothetical protein
MMFGRFQESAGNPESCNQNFWKTGYFWISLQNFVTLVMIYVVDQTFKSQGKVCAVAWYNIVQ